MKNKQKYISLILILFIVLTTTVSCIPNLLDPTPGDFTYKDFTPIEKQILLTYLGELIPFIETDDYTFREYIEGEGYESGIRYYTLGNSNDDFNNYRNLFSAYELTDTTSDEDNVIWYHYEKGNVAVAMAYYILGNTEIIDVIAYYAYNEPISSGMIENYGAGLPDGVDGVHEVDFTEAEYIRDVTEQHKYQGGCPTTGSPAVLVIPVEFSDAWASERGCKIENIERIFNGDSGETDYYSVDEYYYISSYGKLDLEITVLDHWFKPQNSSAYYKKQVKDYNGESVSIGDQMVLDEALCYLEDKMDLSKFDSDGNGTIDAVVLVTTLKIDQDNSFNWAYRYWNIYSDKNDNLYEYDGVYAHDYIWAPYGFIHEKLNSRGTPSYSDKTVMNPQTFIHEFGHILGADDYYDTSYRKEEGPLLGHDIMDSELGDHNPYTKFNLGWINSSRLVTAESKLTLSLKPFSETGDTIIISNNWNDSLGAYQEYFVLVYYKNTGLNGGIDGYFEEDGIVVYHVNASLYYEQYLNSSYYDVGNNNTTQAGSDGYGSANNLLELVTRKKDYSRLNIIFTSGESLPTIFDDREEILHFTFTVDSITEDEAIITFSRK